MGADSAGEDELDTYQGNWGWLPKGLVVEQNEEGWEELLVGHSQGVVHREVVFQGEGSQDKARVVEE